MIRLNCFFEASNAVSYDNALDAATTLAMKSQKHEGCIAYDVFTSEMRPTVFMICETWQDEESLAKHEATPEFKEKVAIIRETGKMKIEKFAF